MENSTLITALIIVSILFIVFQFIRLRMLLNRAKSNAKFYEETSIDNLDRLNKERVYSSQLSQALTQCKVDSYSTRDSSREISNEPVNREPKTKYEFVDWSNRTFPAGYIIPVLTRVVMANPIMSDAPIGAYGFIKELSSFPKVIWREYPSDAEFSHNLVPYDPKDHPEHPMFGKANEPLL